MPRSRNPLLGVTLLVIGTMITATAWSSPRQTQKSERRRRSNEIRLRGFPLIVTHAMSTFDSAKVAKRGIDRLIAAQLANKQQVIFLKTPTDKETWYTRRRKATLTRNSEGGEHKAQIYARDTCLAGGYLGFVNGARGCLNASIADAIRGYRGRKTQRLHLPLDAIYRYRPGLATPRDIRVEDLFCPLSACGAPMSTIGNQVLPPLKRGDVWYPPKLWATKRVKGKRVRYNPPQPGRINPVSIENYTFMLFRDGKQWKTVGKGTKPVEIHLWSTVDRLLDSLPR